MTQKRSRMTDAEAGIRARKTLQSAERYINRHGIQNDDHAFSRVRQSADYDEISRELAEALLMGEE